MTIEKAIKEIFDVVNAFIKAKDEEGPGGSEINLFEKIDIGMEGIDLVKVAAGYEKLIIEWKSRNPEKMEEWKQAFAENFDIPNDELEQIIESLVNKGLELATNFERLSVAKK